MATILVVDDEKDIRNLIEIYLKNEGMRVCSAECATEALEILGREQIDLAILDVMMPDTDGITLCMRIREKSNISIIMASAKDQDMDKVIGLTAGADDYVAKPFNPIELIARVKAQLRRSITFNNAINSDVLEYDGLCMELDHHRVTLNGKTVALTPKEYGILELLWRNRGIVFSTEKIYNRIWGENGYEVDNTVMVHIRNLRHKIETENDQNKYIQTVWGIGYKFGT